MADARCSLMRVRGNPLSKFVFNPICFVLLVISGSLEQPVEDQYKHKVGLELAESSREWLESLVRASDRWDPGFDVPMMQPQSQGSSAQVDQGSHPLQLEPYKYQLINPVYSDNVNVNLLQDNAGNNNVNSFDMAEAVEAPEVLGRHTNESGTSRGDGLEGVKRSGVGVDELISWNSAAQDDWWSVCQLPVFLVLFAVVGVLAVTLVVLLWLKRQMLQSDKEKQVPGLDAAGGSPPSASCPCVSPAANHGAGERWIFHTVINLKPAEEGDPSAVQVQPVAALPPRTPTPEPLEAEKRPEAVRIKAKGLLERRGSSASLTIDLPQATSESTQIVTPTRECTSEEFLLSAGNVLSRQHLRNCLKNCQALHHEFWEIPLNHPESCTVTGCGLKNRYRSILPNDRTRVKLVKLDCEEDNPLDQYINANFIRGYDGEDKAYIATQGPLSNTIVDFYRMVWDNRCPIIVMMTKLCEKSKPKCELYFPLEEGTSCCYGDVKVTVTSLQHKQGYAVRELLVEYNEETRRLLHYWYDTWPDHKAPHNAQSIVAMATEIEKCRTNLKNQKSANNNESMSLPDGPVVAHCSAGIGRTGCFIAISLAMCQLLEEDKVDVLGIVCQMRYDRGGMVQTAEQYEFVHRAVALFEHSMPESGAD